MTSAAEAARIEAVSTAESLALFGALVGGLQWLVLRHEPYARWWVPATVLGWSLTGFLVGALSGLAFGSVSGIGPDRDWPVMLAAASSGAAVGVLPSLFQFLALRRSVKARSWPLVSLVGLGLGVVAGGLIVRWGLVDLVSWLTPEDFPSAKALVCVGAVVGTAYGLVTARTVGRLLDDRKPARPSARRLRDSNPGGGLSPQPH